MQPWATEEVNEAGFGDKRLDKRLMTLVNALAAHPTASLPEACGKWAAVKGAYRFLDSVRVAPKEIREAHRSKTVARVSGRPVVLIVQDTTALDYSRHPATRGMGMLDAVNHRGLKVHSALAVSTEGVPLGLLGQHVWARDPEARGKAKRRRELPTGEKESQRWLSMREASEQGLPKETMLVTMADREADIFALFALEREENRELLIRAAHNRRIDGETQYLFQAVQQSPARGQLTVAVGRRAGQEPRKALLEVRYAFVKLQPAHRARRCNQATSIPMNVILVQEEHAPAGVTPISWLLLTTLPVAKLEDAARYVQWYSYRWLIERYHFVLKSGCGLERLQLEERARLERALAVYCIVAWVLLWLTYEARQKPDSPCDIVLEAHEWKALYCKIHNTPTPATSPPTLSQAVRWIALLGGFLGRRSDGEPGVKTIWRGLRHLQEISDIWLLLHQ